MWDNYRAILCRGGMWSFLGKKRGESLGTDKKGQGFGAMGGGGEAFTKKKG